MRAILPATMLLWACSENLTPPPDRDPYAPPDQEQLSCLPDLDGRIEAREIQAALGIPVHYLVSPAGEEREVDLSGSVEDGQTLWDWSVDLDDDELAELEAEPLEEQWYAGSFAAGSFVSPLDAGATVEAVYREDEEALWLLGVASAEPDPPEGRTLVVYEDPVAAFQFPLAPGSAWVATGEIRDGTLRGLPYAGRDIYEVVDDAMGTLALPDLTFTQAHRVRTRVTVQPTVGQSVSRRQVSFVFECFGEVARATSRDDEPEEDFTRATEVRRLGLR
ncbi:MAG: hypothetical protein HYY06_02695 [Deltaproteobacteria bacterium]|nr:hypothetical protein [Deltaproteobacteria bacterium]